MSWLRQKPATWHFCQNHFFEFLDSTFSEKYEAKKKIRAETSPDFIDSESFTGQLKRMPSTRDYHWTPNQVLESHSVLVVIEAETHRL